MLGNGVMLKLPAGSLAKWKYRYILDTNTIKNIYGYIKCLYTATVW